MLPLVVQVFSFFCIMTKLIFRSSIHYDQTLAQLAGASLSLDASQELDQFVQEIQSLWNQYNDSFFSYFAGVRVTMPEVWYVYSIHANGKITSFAEPTTIIIRGNKDEVIATLVHELCHVFCGLDQNEAVLSPIWEKISVTFQMKDIGTREHIFVNVLARAGLRHIFGNEKAESLLGIEKKYEGLQRAWEIIDASKSTVYDEPLKFLEELATE